MNIPMNDAIEEFMELFQGRPDAYGTWQGGSVKEPTNYKTFARHLYGEELVGIYPLLDNSTVRWGCSDIDVDEIDLARNLQFALQLKGIPAFLEKTVRGFHVWVFASEPIQAAVMRRAFLSAHEAINLVAKEINPKQEQAKDVGNYVRLPYPAGMVEFPENRFMLDDYDKPIALGTFLSEALENRVTAEQLIPLAEMHHPKVKAILDMTTVRASVEQALTYCNEYVRTIWKNGPLPGSDRSSILCMMTHRMVEHNVPMGMAYIVLVDADKRWGKYHLRDNATEMLTDIIEKIYGSDTTGTFNP